MRILISNDDGVHARGLKVLYQELKKLGQVWVVAPLEEKSTTGHSLTLHKPLRIIEMGDHFYGVSGSPADCVNLGIREIMRGKPDLVISGINRGANLGQDVFYSGTVSAAREACIQGMSSIAVSCCVEFGRPLEEEKIHYDTAAKLTYQVIKKINGQKIPRGTMLNLNVPDLPLRSVKGLYLARQGFRHYTGNIIRRTDHRGKPYFWVGGKYKGFKKEKGTDCFLINEKYASLTPIQLDTTNYDFLDDLSDLWPKLDSKDQKVKRKAN